ncbi:MAG: AbrB/MazE/SpoVT family DNA-binding domain-containing protein [Deferribacteraceae bacterium]|jgi:AbrB family looped-hinge helix DNA binding protein|nr:AbrB/MazE/SpoVT family DNA-binding domain-containing protein [Deferribacteraceae bacterium]
MSTITKISKKGQLVIPKKIRDKIGLQGGSVSIAEHDGVITIRKTKDIFDIVRSIKVSDDFNAEQALQEAQRDIADEKNKQNT